MFNTQSLVRRIHERKTGINLDVNSKIKYLQKRLVTLSFRQGNHTIEYFNTLGQIEKLRKNIFLQ